MTVLEAPRTPVLPAGIYTPWAGPYPVVRISAAQLLGLAGLFGKLLGFLRGDRALAQLIRFALVGGSSNIAYVLLFFAMHGVGPLMANVVGSVVSTVIANELHRQLTFHAADRVGWFTAQWEGGGLALVGLGISTAGLAALAVWAPGLGDATQAAAVLAITAAVGLMRFLALRGLVF
ncbi:GtrA family protein [Nocardia bovistercoris]|uniref:GtrA family protein n=1 Tax=Nocardia bovistercoris TaxID=2785916 RepID=A0A931N0Y0_9NOCA|nr:GtrA family protein [Nocardia bovistercoris]MBH0775429.1 GtrA family protein [Nocardia bovistercoris]